MWFRTRADRESASTRQARESAQRAEAELVEVRGRRRVVTNLAEAIDLALARNHFGESIERAISLRKGTL